ncbi:MAG: outer membrane protein assembly factor BamE [Comamonas sp.]
MTFFSRIGGMLAVVALGALGLVGCDQQKIAKLEEGSSTEADVRAEFGEPAYVWNEPDGSRTFEYNRQPAGHRNYMITIGADGKMASLRQVLAPHMFEKIQPVMTDEQVRRMLCMPAKRMRFALNQETDWDWQWIDPPNREMVFTVTFSDQGRVIRSASVQKPPEGNH